MKTILKKSGVLAAAALLSFSFISSSAAAEGDKKPGKTKKDHFAQVDTDGNGKVSLDEFKARAAKSKKEPKPTDAQLEKKFKRLDKDKSADLSKEEMAAGHAKKDGGKPESDKPAEKPKSE